MPLDGTRQIPGHHDPVSTRVQKASMPLYANRIKVYPKAVDGTFRRIKWAVLIVCLAVYHIVPWLRWNRGPGAPDQAVLLDLPGERAYFFGIELWPQEIYYLAGLLIFAAITLFLVTSLMGRVWCGYACPQTVWTDLFMLVERLIEGDRNARIRLDQQPLSVAKAARKVVKHASWLIIAAVTGGAWVFYFADAPTALRAIFTGGASAEVYFFVGLFTATTYLLAGWAREQVCTYMCPWPRFQAAMFDENTLIVTYRNWRGERRGKHKAGESWEGRGDCIDCRQCVAVCPTGIDIRDGQQMECIGCGLCIDACDSVMGKVERPRSLIAFDTFASQASRAAGAKSTYRFIRPRVLLYAGLLTAVGTLMLTAFALRSEFEVNVLRDRTPLYVTLADGSIRNGYTVKILNKTRGDRAYRLSVLGLADAAVNVIGISEQANAAGELILSAKTDSIATFRVYVSAPRASLHGDSTPLIFNLHSSDGREAAIYRAVFLGPSK